MEAECHVLESTSIRRHNMLLTFSDLENFRKKPHWELRPSLGPEIPFWKLPLGLYCEAGRRESGCYLGRWKGALLTLSSTLASLDVVF